ncbi:hypothetical protein C2S52_006894 [Perilla frutescens var. hirtella]|nr:hypothetical protein C2S52_006894 [Perilla frutescens var. hirtella]
MLPPRHLTDSDYVYLILQEILVNQVLQLFVIVHYITKLNSRKRKRNTQAAPYCMILRIPDQVKHMCRIVGLTDVDYDVNLRMGRNAFGRLRQLLRDLGGLVDGRYISVQEQVAMFLSVLAHHKKIRVVRFDFWRSGQTCSRYIHLVLRAILRLHVILLVKPEPIPDDCTDSRWKWFKGCLSVLDGTYINVIVSNTDKPRYRTRKGQISTNVLAVCDRKMQFVYVLPRMGPTNARPQNKEELFNLKHSKARNVIERAFGIMKMIWGILRSTTYYPIKIQNRLMMCFFLLNNFIRSQMNIDPIEQQFDMLVNDEGALGVDGDEFFDTVESSPEWNTARDHLADGMWNDYINAT